MLDSEQYHQEDATIANTLVEKTNITSFPNIKHFLFRNPRAGLEVVSKYCPSLNKVRSISLFCQDNENDIWSLHNLLFQKYIFIFLGPHNIQCLRVLVRCPIRRLSHRIDIVQTIPRKFKVFFCSTWLELYEYVICYSGNMPTALIINMSYWVLITEIFMKMTEIMDIYL